MIARKKEHSTIENRGCELSKASNKLTCNWRIIRWLVGKIGETMLSPALDHQLPDAWDRELTVARMGKHTCLMFGSHWKFTEMINHEEMNGTIWDSNPAG